MASPEKPTIKKIVFNVRGKTLELTKEEAIELKGVLSDLFGEKETVYVDRWHHTYPWNYPHWTYTSGTISSGQSQTLSGLTSNTVYLNAIGETNGN